MTNIPPNPTPGQLPPASTTNYSARNIGASIAARRKAGPAAKPVQESQRTRAVADVASLYDAAPAQAAPQSVVDGGRPLRLSELAAAVTRAKRGRRAVAESRDPDGPDDGGYDPQEIVRTTRSGAATAASVVGALQRRRQG